MFYKKLGFCSYIYVVELWHVFRNIKEIILGSTQGLLLFSSILLSLSCVIKMESGSQRDCPVQISSTHVF